MCGKLNPSKFWLEKWPEELDLQKSLFFALLYTAGGCMKLLRCYLHNPQIAFLILNVWFVGYMVYWVPVYLHNLQCSVCGEDAIFWKNEFSLTQPQLAVSCYNIAQPVTNILAVWRDHFALFVPGVLIYFVIYSIVFVAEMQNLEKELSQTQPQLSAIWFCCYLHNPSLIFKETFLLPWWYIRFHFISVISNRVFVARNVNYEKNSQPQYTKIG